MSDAELRDLERQARTDEGARLRLARAYQRLGLGWHGEPLPRTRTGLEVRLAEEVGVYVLDLPWGPRLELVHVAPDSVDEDVPTLSFEFSARARGYYLGRFPVTWEQVEDSGVRFALPPWFEGPGLLRRAIGAPAGPTRADRALHPVVNASHRPAEQLLEKAGLRLPTVAEWRREAMLGGGPFPWGDAPPSPERCVLAEHPEVGGRTTAPVAVRVGDRLEPARPLGASRSGACDLVGNVNELTNEGGVVGRSFLTPTAAAADYRQTQNVHFAMPDLGFRAALDALPPRRRAR